MYGYVRPNKGELKVSEYERFRGVYCGLCHELKARYGPICRFLVNYDFTFLAMLFAENQAPETKICRCPYHPLRKTMCPKPGCSMAIAADCTVVLAYWKLKDGIADKRFWGSLGCRIACAFLKRHYKKASGLQPEFAVVTETNLRELGKLEEEKCRSLDAAADRFAVILRASAACIGDDTSRRVLHELLYHLGRIVYILDAVDDLPEDMRSGSYNPLIYRFSLQEGMLSSEQEQELRASLQLSHNSICNAFALMENNPYQGILANIIYTGLPSVAAAVFAGTWKTVSKPKKERSHV